MILPSKHISESKSLIGIGAVLLRMTEQPQTVATLWEAARDDYAIGNFERFVLALDMLFISGAIAIDESLIFRTKP